MEPIAIIAFDLAMGYALDLAMGYALRAPPIAKLMIPPGSAERTILRK